MRNIIKKWFGISRVEKILNNFPNINGKDFILKANQEFNVVSEIISLTDVSSFHSTVFFCTHHTGALDFLSVYPTLSNIAPNLKVVLNNKLHSLTPLKEISIAVNPISSGKNNGTSLDEIRLHLARGGNILIFPAGKVGQKVNGKVQDFPWRTGMGDILKTHASCAVPVYVEARNSDFFYLIRKYFPKISMGLLLKVLSDKPQNKARVFIGKPLYLGQESSSGPELISQIRSHTYQLPNNFTHNGVLHEHH